MGEVADMMLDGTLCVMCGVALQGHGDDFPRACSNACARDYGAVGISEDGYIIHDKDFAERIGLKMASDKVDVSYE